jgi:hypothetical protein
MLPKKFQHFLSHGRVFCLNAAGKSQVTCELEVPEGAGENIAVTHTYSSRNAFLPYCRLGSNQVRDNTSSLSLPSFVYMLSSKKFLSDFSSRRVFTYE